MKKLPSMQWFSDVTAASFVTAGDQTLPDNTEGEMDETVENVDDERSQDESEEG